MKKRLLAVLGCCLACLVLRAEAATSNAATGPGKAQARAEQKHFLECLATVYSPEWWISYNDALYFHPHTEAQAQELEAMVAARANYVSLTNRETRYAVAGTIIAASGIGRAWQQKVLLPFSDTNSNLTPTLDKPVRFVPAFTVQQALTNGDAWLQDGPTTLFVMNFGRAASDAAGTNALLLKEGTKTYVAGKVFKTVDAFSDVGLSREEAAALNKVAAAFREHAADLVEQASPAQANEEFELLKARATDSNPYMQYLLAKAYLDGQGTSKDDKAGLDWMRRAARNGSGDATTYLEALKKAP